MLFCRRFPKLKTNRMCSINTGFVFSKHSCLYKRKLSMLPCPYTGGQAPLYVESAAGRVSPTDRTPERVPSRGVPHGVPPPAPRISLVQLYSLLLIVCTCRLYSYWWGSHEPPGEHVPPHTSGRHMTVALATHKHNPPERNSSERLEPRLPSPLAVFP